MSTQHERLHYTLQKVISKIKKPKKKTPAVQPTPVPTTTQLPALYNNAYPGQQAYPQTYPAAAGAQPTPAAGYPQFPSLEQTYQDYTTQQYQIQTLEQQYQMQTHYRLQLEEQENLLAAQASPFTTTLDPLQLHAERMEEENITISYQQEVEARCHALMKEQKKHYIQFALDFAEMKLLEKSTRTLWIGNLSEWITENQVKEAAKLYGHVMSINIVRNGVTEDARGYKRCFGFIEFSKRETVEIFLKTSNLMLCGEKITSRPGNVPSQIQQKCHEAGYIFDTTNQCTPLFEMILDAVDTRFSKEQSNLSLDAKPKTVEEYFPNLPE